MPSIPNKPRYSHGSTGTEPSSPIDYTNGDPVNQSEFDYFIYTPFNRIKGIIDFLNAVDSDGDGIVDEADDAVNVTATYKGNDIDTDGDGKVNSADVADSAQTYKGNDIDSDGDGRVDQADVADQATRFEVRNTDPNDPDDGQVWIRDDL